MRVFAERFRSALKAKQLNQTQLAHITELDQSCINRFATGKSEPYTQSLYAICVALDVSADYLLGLTDDMEAHKRCSAG